VTDLTENIGLDLLRTDIIGPARFLWARIAPLAPGFSHWSRYPDPAVAVVTP
jgi:hypothetical protein